MKRISLIIAVLIYLPLSGLLWSSDFPGYDLIPGPFSISNFKIGLVITPSSVSDIDQIAAMEKPHELVQSRLISATPENTYWAVFNLRNNENEDLEVIIRIDEYGPDRVNLYYNSDSGWVILRNGMTVSVSRRQIPSRIAAFSVVLQPGENIRFFLEYHSAFVTPTNIHIEDPETFYRGEVLYTAGYWFFFGAAIVMLLYNLFLSVSLRDKSYYLYVSFIFFFLIFAVLYSGFSGFVNTSPRLHYILSSSVGLIFVFLILFTKQMLNLRDNWPLAEKILTSMAVIFILGTVLVLIDIKFAMFIGVLGMPASIIMLIIGIIGIFRKIRLSNYYVYAISVYLLGVFSIIALNLDLVPHNFFTRYAYLFGSLIEMVMFSLALAFRFKQAQEEKILFQNKLYDSEKQSRENLEKIVQERTAELSKVNKELEKMAVVDGLTGLYNRRHFDHMLEVEWNRLQRTSRPVSLIMCDIDFFKNFNDSFGHLAGDDCIRSVAGIIRGCVGRDSDVPARYGGEEFAVILPGTDSDGARQIARCIQMTLSERALDYPGSQRGYVSMSYGISTLFPTQPPGSQALVAAADKALYKSKNDGRDRISIA